MSEITTILSQRPNGETALQNWNETLLTTFRALPARTIEDVLVRCNTPERTLIGLKGKIGEGAVRAFLVLAIIDFSKFFSVDKDLSGSQVAQLVMDIMDEYWHLTIDDLKVFFANCRYGRYGKIYNRLDGFVILEWLGQYTQERALQAANMSRKEAASLSFPDRYTRTSSISEAEALFNQAKSKLR